MSKQDIFQGADDSSLNGPFDGMEILDAGIVTGEVSEEELEKLENEDETEEVVEEDNTEVKDDGEEEEEVVVEDDVEDEDEEAVPELDVIGKTWQKKGILSEDFKLPKDATVEDFQSALYDDIYAPFKLSAEADAEAYKETLLKEKGYDERTLEIAANINKGVSNESINKAEAIKKIEALEVSGESEAVYDNREALIRAMYQQKGLGKDDIDRLVETAQEDGSDEKRSKEAKTYLADKFKADIASDVKAKEDKLAGIEKVKDNFIKSVKTMIDAGEIMDGANKESLYNDLYEPDQWVKVKNAEGKMVPRKTTLWNKKMLEYGITINPINIKDLEGDKLKNFLALTHLIMHGNVGEEKIKAKVKKEQEDDLDKYLKGRSTKASKKTKADWEEQLYGVIDPNNII